MYWVFMGKLNGFFRDIRAMAMTNCSTSCPPAPMKAMVEFCIEGVAIPVVGGLGLGGNLAAILVLR